MDRRSVPYDIEVLGASGRGRVGVIEPAPPGHPPEDNTQGLQVPGMYKGQHQVRVQRISNVLEGAVG